MNQTGSAIHLALAQQVHHDWLLQDLTGCSREETQRKQTACPLTVPLLDGFNWKPQGTVVFVLFLGGIHLLQFETNPLGGKGDSWNPKLNPCFVEALHGKPYVGINTCLLA